VGYACLAEHVVDSGTQALARQVGVLLRSHPKKGSGVGHFSEIRL